jgi:hypothetical protein
MKPETRDVERHPDGTRRGGRTGRLQVLPALGSAWALLAVCALLLITSGGVRAQTVDFWLNAPGDADNFQRSNLIVTPGSTITLSLWYESTATHYLMETLVGFDTATSKGTDAVPQDNRLALNGGSLSSGITYANPPGWGSPFAQEVGGGEAAGAANRPYGVRTVLFTLSAIAPVGATKVYDIHLDVAADFSAAYDVTIWNNPAGGEEWTSFILEDGTDAIIRPAATYRLTLIPVPGPSSLIVLAAGLLPFAGLMSHRKRKPER